MVSNYIKLFVNGYPPGTKLTAKFYFVEINNILNQLKIILFLINITRHAEKIEMYLNEMPKIRYTSKKVVAWTVRLIKVFYVVMCSVMFLSRLITTNTIGGGIKSPAEVFKNYVSVGRARFFMDLEFESFSPLNIFLGIFESLSQLCMNHVFWTHYVFYICPLPFTFWLVANELEEFMNKITLTLNRVTSPKECERLLQTIDDKVEQTINFCDSVNKVWAVNTLIWVIDVGIRLMIYLNDLVKSRDWANMIVMVVWYTMIGIALALSAETYRKVVENVK